VERRTVTVTSGASRQEHGEGGKPGKEKKNHEKNKKGEVREALDVQERSVTRCNRKKNQEGRPVWWRPV